MAAYDMHDLVTYFLEYKSPASHYDALLRKIQRVFLNKDHQQFVLVEILGWEFMCRYDFFANFQIVRAISQ